MTSNQTTFWCGLWRSVYELPKDPFFFIISHPRTFIGTEHWILILHIIFDVISTSSLSCACFYRSVMQSTLNCLTTAFLGSRSMRGYWGWKAHQVTRLQRSDQALCTMRRYCLPFLISHCLYHFVYFCLRYLWFQWGCCKFHAISLLVFIHAPYSDFRKFGNCK